jgi:carbonic anhydrase
MSRSAPIIIVKNTQADKICNLKCAYKFDYAPTNLQIKNMGTYLRWKVDEVSTPPVVYNDDFYNVLEARLYWNSLHAYLNNSTTNPVYADAELVIVHLNRKNTSQLLVCIPITQSSTTTADSAMFFDFILTEVARTAPSKGQQTSYNKSTFSLDKFVPKKPFYSYNGTFPWPPENESVDYIVFDKEDAITMSTNAYAVLKKVTRKSEIDALSIETSGAELFYNPTGPVPPNAGEIYIDCQPTGDDGEILVPAKLDSGGVLDNELLKRMWNFTIVKILIGALVMIILWKLAMNILNSIAKSASKVDVGRAVKEASIGNTKGAAAIVEAGIKPK